MCIYIYIYIYCKYKHCTCYYQPPALVAPGRGPPRSGAARAPGPIVYEYAQSPY